VAEEYDPGKFYTKATDKRGHSKQIRFSLPPDVAYQVGNLVADKRYPYLNTHELVRDALIHRLHFLTQLDPDAIEVDKLYRLMVRQSEVEERLASIDASHQLLENYNKMFMAVQSRDEFLSLGESVRATLHESKDLGLSSFVYDGLLTLLNRIEAHVERLELS